MRRVIATVGALLLLGTVGVGAVSADPINGNSRYFSASCNGELVDFVTNMGASGHVVGDSRVFVLFGATEDGAWIVPLVPGQSKKDLVVCTYTELFDGHQFVVYGKFKTA